MSTSVTSSGITFPDATTQTTAASAGGAWALEAEYDFNTQNAADSVVVSFTAGDYKQIKFVLQDVQLDSDGGYLGIQFGNGTTVSTSGYFVNVRYVNGSTNAVYTNYSYGRLALNTLGGVNDETHSGEIVVHTGSGVGKSHGAKANINITNSGNSPIFYATEVSHNVGYTSASPMNYIKFFPTNSKNFDRGIIQVWSMS
jgi:hypothetical protein